MEAEAASGEAALGVSEELLPSAALCSLLASARLPPGCFAAAGYCGG